MDTLGQMDKGFSGKPIQLTLTPGGDWNGMVGVLEKWMGMAEELSAYHARDLAEAQKRGEEALKQLEQVTAEKEAVLAELQAAKTQLEECRSIADTTKTELASLKAKSDSLEESLKGLEWMPEARNSCIKVCNDLVGLFGERKPVWYADEFDSEVCNALMSVYTLLALSSPFVSPTEIMLGIDKAFFKNLGPTGSDALEKARKLYMGWFNEQAGELYQICWPQPGSEFDPSYCVREEDNGFTGVRFATSCAVYKGGQLTEKARVMTVAR